VVDERQSKLSVNAKGYEVSDVYNSYMSGWKAGHGQCDGVSLMLHAHVYTVGR